MVIESKLKKARGYTLQAASIKLRCLPIAYCLLLTFLSLALNVQTATAQVEKDKWGEGEIQKVEVVIEKDRQITVPQANRNFEKVTPRPAEPIKPEIKYQFKNLSFNVSDYNPAIRPLKLKTEPIS